MLLQTSHPLPGEVGECLTTDRGTHYYVLCVESEDSQGDTTARYYIHYTITFSTVFWYIQCSLQISQFSQNPIGHEKSLDPHFVAYIGTEWPNLADLW